MVLESLKWHLNLCYKYITSTQKIYFYHILRCFSLRKFTIFLNTFHIKFIQSCFFTDKYWRINTLATVILYTIFANCVKCIFFREQIWMNFSFFSAVSRIIFLFESKKSKQSSYFEHSLVMYPFCINRSNINLFILITDEKWCFDLFSYWRFNLDKNKVGLISTDAKHICDNPLKLKHLKNAILNMFQMLL